MDYLKVWTSFREVIAPLGDAEKGRLFDAMLVYAETGEEPSDFKGNERFLWAVAKQDIDRTAQKCEKLQANASKGGLAKSRNQQIVADCSKSYQTLANDSKCQQTEANAAHNNNSNNKDNNKDNIKEKEIYKEKESKPEPQKRFIPPTVEEVSAYCKERNNGIDPEYFVAYYTTRNWIMGNGRKMSNWKAAVITWEKNNFSNGSSSSQTKKVNAQQYQQRDYGDKDDDVVKRLLRMNGGETA